MASIDSLINDINWFLIQEAFKEMQKLLEIALKKVKEKTPTDTHLLIDSIEIEWPIIQGNTITARVFVTIDKVPYAIWVEWWNGGRSVNWHKDGKVFYINPDGAMMFTRTQVEINDLLLEVFG